ncbi:MAG: hypothetical protein AB7P20_03030, partial [Rhizobiaceae bacterium]
DPSAGPPPFAEIIPSDVAPADCGCGCGGTKKDCGCGCGGAGKVAVQPTPQRIMALGQIGYDFLTEARRDSFLQFLPQGAVINPETIIEALSDGDDISPEIERITWTLNIDQTPIYAIRPSGAFAFNGYAQLLEAFKAQNVAPTSEPTKGDKRKRKWPVTLFAVAGVTIGKVRLMSGETVPVLAPTSRGIIWWDIQASLDNYVKQAERFPTSLGLALRREDNDRFERAFSSSLADFRDLMTRKYRNLGLLGRERALNFAATAAYRVFEMLDEIVGLGLIIDDISVHPSPACRTGSECYDVRIKTFRQSDVTAALRVFQFTLDVSDTIPVNVGALGVWSERP